MMRPIVIMEKQSIYVEAQLYRNLTAYYPYGLPLAEWQGEDRYLYSGKELERTDGLMLYDHHARLYDPQLGRFISPDPLAADYAPTAPHLYCAANPIAFIDPTGKYMNNANEQKAKTLQSNIGLRIKLLYYKNFSPQSGFSFTPNTQEQIKTMTNTIFHINHMINDKEKEYQYLSNTTNNMANETILLPYLNSKGHHIIGMYCDTDDESMVHESTHGWQISSNKMKIINGQVVDYCVDSEIEAYKAQFSLSGSLTYPIAIPNWPTETIDNLIENNMLNMSHHQNTIESIFNVTPSMIRSIYNWEPRKPDDKTGHYVPLYKNLPGYDEYEK